MTRARDIADTQENLGGPVPPFVAGKNGFINGGFDIWQRGTSLAGGAFKNYTADRWAQFRAGITVSRQLTADTTNLPFIQYCARVQRDSGTSGVNINLLMNSMATSDAIPFAGKTVTMSFYARKGANYSATSSGLQASIYSGTGTDQALIDGYTGQITVSTTTVALTTTWQRFSFTGTVGATATELSCEFAFTPTGTAGVADYYEVTGVQLEIGSQATPFARTGGNIQGELAACQRYFQRYGGASLGGEAFASIGLGYVANAAGTQLIIDFPFITSMRTAPSSVSFNNLVGNNTITDYAVSAVTLRSSQSSNSRAQLNVTIASATQHRPLSLISNGSTGFLDLNGEL